MSNGGSEARLMWVRELAWIDPVEAAARLAGLGSRALLDSAMTHPTLGRFSYVAADPFGVFQVRDGVAFWDGTAEPASPIAALRLRLAACRLERRDGLPPFQGGAIGSIGYEFGWALEGRRAPVSSNGDDVHLAFHDVVLAFDHITRGCWLIASGCPAATPEARRERAEARLTQFVAHLSQPSGQGIATAPYVEWRSDLSRDAYRAGVERVKGYIREGDIYQANIAQRFVADVPKGADLFALYRMLRASNPAPFAAYLECGPRQILSTSPELFLRSDGRHVETRPIKGTARRAADAAVDRDIAARLMASRKDRAENVMIVDLLRNDLSRVCTSASVDVPVLCGLETYAGLHHLVSAVTGNLVAGRDVLDLVAASFPGGSITGAPKLRAMEIIAEIEGRARGVYCGAIGWIGFDGALDLNIAIRTISAEGGRVELCAGGGITILSDPDAEYEETLTKAQRIFDAFASARTLAEAVA